MRLFKRKNRKKNINKELIEEELLIEEKRILESGQRTLKDLMAPSSIDRSNPNYLLVNNKYVKSFILNGYPTHSYVGWLSDLYDYPGELDTALYIEPTDLHVAREELTKKITEYETQLFIEQESGSSAEIGKLTNTIVQLKQQRDQLEKNREDLFYVQIYANLYADSEKELKMKNTMLMNKLKGKKVGLMPSYREQDECFKNVLPYGKIYTGERHRSVNTGGVTGCFPFYNSDIINEEGIILGENLSTNMLVMLDSFDRDKSISGNTTIIGRSGSGKSYLVKLRIMRSVFKGIRTVIIDPEREYARVTREVGGSHINLSPNSNHKINPFDLEEEDQLDDYGRMTGRKIVNIMDKISDVLNLVAVMYLDGFTGKQNSITAIVINQLYQDFNFTTDPKSLYVTKSYFDEDTQIFYHAGDKKPMPTFSDFHKLLTEYAEETDDKEIMDLSKSLEIFKKGQVYGMFDCQTSDNIDLENSPVITFDVFELEENLLRPVGMYVALTWAWDKFGKKNMHQKKEIIVEEAWQMLTESLAGSEYSAAFLDVTSRRIRKRNGNLVVASQSFKEFKNSPKGQAVLTNSPINIFLKQASTDIDDVEKVFKLSKGESNFISTSKRGEALLRLEDESVKMNIFAFPHEKQIIDEGEEEAKHSKEQAVA